VAAVITLTTDFGTRDGYVAELKAVILGLAASARLVDITHEVEPQQVAEAALTLGAVAPRFPPGTIHVAVVDPGVGTARRGIVLAAGHQLFVGPDNGLFSPFLRAPGWVAHQLSAPELRLPAVSPTFHGRDVFAPAAAYLALGVEPARFGPPVQDPVTLAHPEPRQTGKGLAATVIHVDRFGNLVTSVDAGRLAGLGGGATVRIRGRVLRVVRTFGDLPPGGLGALLGSRGWLEVVARDGSAASRLRAGRGTAVLVSPTRPASGSRRRPLPELRRNRRSRC
jgi:S-adenosylmethionine hydrolase